MQHNRNQTIIYGINPVVEALKAGRQIYQIYTDKQSYISENGIMQLVSKKNIPIKLVPKDFFDSRFYKGHQGIAAVVEPKKLLTMNDLLDIPLKINEPAFFLITDCIEDPRNFGAILRVADAANVQGVVFQSKRSSGITPVVSKVSAGAVEYINLVELPNIKYAIKKFKDNNITVIGAEAQSDLTFWDIDMTQPLAILVGSEGHGIRRTVKEMCNFVVKLPLKGTVNSLNVSVATSILLYEVMRQRNYKK